MDFLLQIGKFLLFSLLSELLRPKMKRTGPAAGGLKDLSFPTVDPTRPHQWLIGRRIIDNANLFGTWDFKAVERSKKVRTGIFSKERIPLPPVYYVSSAMVLCGGTGARLKKIYLGDRVLWTGDLASGGAVNVNLTWSEEGQEDYPRGLIARIEFHSGTNAPNAYLQAKQGAANTPAWKHLTYVVIRGQDGSAYPGAWIGTNKVVEHIKFETEKMPTAVSTGLGAHPDGGSYWTVDGDANPAYAVAELIVDRNYGAGEPADILDAEAFHAAAKKLHTEAHGTSQLWDSQRATGDVILELCRQTGAVLLPEPRFGLQQFRLLRAEEESLMVLDDDNIVLLDTFSRSAMSESTNVLALQYVAKDELYAQRPVEVQDLAAIEAAGQVITGQTSYAGVMNANTAFTIGMRDLRALSAPLAAARLTAIVPKSQRLFPGDPVLFSSPANGVAQLRMRVTSSRYSKPGQALCEVELIEDVFYSGTAVYAIPPAATGGTGAGTTPLPGTVSAFVSRFVPAPYGLNPQAADRGLFYCVAPNTDTLGYVAAFYQTDPTDLEFSDRGTVGCAAQGTLAAPMADITNPGTLVVNISAANAAVLRAFGSQQVFVVVEGDTCEWLQAASLSVNGAGTQVTLGGLTRGIFDTVPLPAPVGSVVHVLCDYVLDPVKVGGTTQNVIGTAVETIPGATAPYAVAYGKNVRGLAAGSAALQLAGVSLSNINGMFGYGTRASKPIAPGNVRLGGIHGGSTQALAKAVTVPATFTVTWAPRARSESLNPWATASGAGESGIAFLVQLDRWNGSTWVSVVNTTTAVGATSHTVTKPATVGLMRLIVTPVLPQSGGLYVQGTSQAWYWTVS